MGTIISSRPFGLHYAIARAIHMRIPPICGARLSQVRYVGDNDFIVSFRQMYEGLVFGNRRRICVKWEPEDQLEKGWLENVKKASEPCV